LKGHATKNIHKDDAMFIAGNVTQKEIYILVQPLSADEPLLMVRPFNENLAQQITEAAKNMCEGKPQAVRGTPSNSQGENNEKHDGVASDVDSLEIYEFNVGKGRVK
jgi:hypothetical protein